MVQHGCVHASTCRTVRERGAQYVEGTDTDHNDSNDAKDDRVRRWTQLQHQRPIVQFPEHAAVPRRGYDGELAIVWKNHIGRTNETNHDQRALQFLTDERTMKKLVL